MTLRLVFGTLHKFVNVNFIQVLLCKTDIETCSVTRLKTVNVNFIQEFLYKIDIETCYVILLKNGNVHFAQACL